MESVGVVTAPERPLLGVGGDAEKFAHGVGVPDRCGELDEPGIGGCVHNYFVGCGVVAALAGEQKDVRRAVYEPSVEVVVKNVFKGFCGVFELPGACKLPRGHRYNFLTIEFPYMIFFTLGP